MIPKPTLRTLVLIWLGWFLVLYGFQSLVSHRLGLLRPDLAVPWTRTETLSTSNRGKIYLLEPFMNKQVAWDSEYYVGIAAGGYDDPKAGRVTNPATGKPVVKNYSFFPLYPFIMKFVAQPFAWLGMDTIAAAVAAGLVVTLLGTLAGMVALWQITRDLLDEDSAFRAVFYMLIFPTAFFFAMVYTEGLFFGLALWSLLLSKRKQWVWASLLAVLAAWTRAHGAALVVPLVWSWLTSQNKEERGASLENWKWWAQGALALLPLAAFLVWRISPLGRGWAELQSFFFGRGFMSILRSVGDIRNAFEYAQTTSHAAVYYSIEAIVVLLALAASIWLFRIDPPVALFGLAVILLSVMSGSVQSLARYMLISPPLYIFLARLGRNKVFDRLWTIASILWLGISATLFAFDMWVG
ncbi:MAG: hypothetical protein EHM70_03120 [Chloroflexota bacterium]|nr:MAG: hypothetical protein EHM70_03120 [Chloroflexota bacterium]